MKSKLIGVIIFILMFTTLMPNFIYAVDEDTKFDINTQDFKTIQENYGEGKFNKLKDEGKADISASAGTKTKQIRETHSLGASLAGIVTTTLLYPVMIASMIITVTTRGNDAFFSDGRLINWFTIEDTVFGRIDMFDADFFTYDTNDVSFNGKIKSSVAVFYYIMKVIAVLAGLVMLIYVGIRMAISTIASEQAKYKEMLKDWLVSMILIFAMPYIITIINSLANGMTMIFASLSPKSFEQNMVLQMMNVIGQTKGWSHVAVSLLYIVMTVYQIKFFIMYTIRMFSMGFLIIISPLITITYAATKTPIEGKSGKARMFDTWFREYSVNAFLQPVHAAIYMVFMVSAYEIFTVAPLLAVLFMMSLSRAEKIVKNIFGMRKMSSIHSMSEYFKMRKK